MFWQNPALRRRVSGKNQLTATLTQGSEILGNGYQKKLINPLQIIYQSCHFWIFRISYYQNHAVNFARHEPGKTSAHESSGAYDTKTNPLQRQAQITQFLGGTVSQSHAHVITMIKPQTQLIRLFHQILSAVRNRSHQRTQTNIGCANFLGGTHGALDQI